MQQTLFEQAKILSALGNEHRLKIVELLSKGECCVCKITPKFKLDPSVISRHLAILERAGIIKSRREGRWIHYQIADRQVLRLIGIVQKITSR